jgi:hypothetical protein
MFYVSKEILLRPLWASDALALRVAPGLEGALSASQAQKMIQHAQEAVLPTLYLGVALRGSSESRAIGVVGLKMLRGDKNPRLVLGFWQEAQSLRLLRQALLGLLEIGFEGLRLPSIGLEANGLEEGFVAQLLGVGDVALLTRQDWRQLCQIANKARRAALVLLTSSDSVGLACP